MKAPDFAYERPASIADAVRLLSSADGDVLPLAGGQSLMPMLNLRLAAPDMLVDLNGISELSGITNGDDALMIGAMTRHVELETSALVAEHLPLVHEAMDEVAHPAIRHRGTIGGSLALADPAAELPACCVAYGATIHVQGANGARKIGAEQFFNGAFDTALEHGEIITSIAFPKQVAGQNLYGFGEICRRKGDYAATGIMVAITTDRSGVTQGAHIVYFGVSDKPARANAAEQMLLECAVPLSAESIKAAAEKAADGIEINADLHTSVETKAHYCRVLAEQALGDLKTGAAL